MVFKQFTDSAIASISRSQLMLCYSVQCHGGARQELLALLCATEVELRASLAFEFGINVSNFAHMIELAKIAKTRVTPNVKADAKMKMDAAARANGAPTTQVETRLLDRSSIPRHFARSSAWLMGPRESSQASAVPPSPTEPRVDTLDSNEAKESSRGFKF